jgi:hypothetical protein
MDIIESAVTGRKPRGGQARQRRRRSPAVPVGERLAYSIPEAGRLLGLSRSGSYAAAKLGHIPTVSVSAKLKKVLKREFHEKFGGEEETA